MNPKLALKIILAISVLGVLFSGTLTYQELFGKTAASCPAVGAPGTVFGYPACVYGFFMYVALTGVAVWGLLGKQSSKTTIARDKSDLIAKQAEEKRKNKEAILESLEGGNQPLTNKQVEQMLGISDATAERYLQELEQEGKIKQVGKTGRAVYYEKM